MKEKLKNNLVRILIISIAALALLLYLKRVDTYLIVNFLALSGVTLMILIR